MSKFSNIGPSMLRIDSSRASQYLYADKPKLNFFQKLGRGVGKALSFLGPIGAAVTAVAVPGIGVPLAAGIYGASRVAGDVTANALNKDASEMAEYNAELAGKQFGMLGFMEPSADPGQIKTDFIAPSEFGPSIERSLDLRSSALMDQLNQY